jgi:hypothetical protein
MHMLQKLNTNGIMHSTNQLAREEPKKGATPKPPLVIPNR